MSLFFFSFFFGGFAGVNDFFSDFPLFFVAIISAYVAGVLGFVYTLPRWTARSAEGSLYWY